MSAHYQHVDGTSFAAPVVASVAAQMLEANPALAPGDVRRILLQTARPVAGIPAIRQGYGVVDPAAAMAAARERNAPGQNGRPRVPPRVERRTTRLHVPRRCGAHRRAVAGDFNGWDPRRLPIERGPHGAWRAEIPVPPPGRYGYKFVVDGSRWLADPSHSFRQPDPYGSFDSLLDVGSALHL